MSILMTGNSSGRLQLKLAMVAVAFSLGSAQDLGRREGRLGARPRTVSTTIAPGFSTLSIGRDRDGQLYVPPAATSGPVPLMVLLHGAGGSSAGIRRRLLETTDSLDFAVLVPDSRGPTWDAIRGDYGPDIAYIDSALKVVFARVAIDPTRITVAGFSDGASYALALGRVNGDLFSRVVAFSPGFVPPSIPIGKPEVLITHGNADPILPFDDTSARIVPALKKAGYAVTLKQFNGGHTIPADVARAAFLWAAGPREVKSAR
jgi:phospholipase/carboxylesterase